MEMTKKIVFFDALSDEAKEKARDWYKSGNDYPFLEEEMTELILGEFEALGYTVEGLKLAYSLSYSQGDGVSFEATITKGDERWNVERTNSRYCHEYTMDIRLVTDDGEVEDEAMANLCREIAVKAKKAGYSEIEYEDSDEAVDESIMANEYTFTVEGVRMDADNI